MGEKNAFKFIILGGITIVLLLALVKIIFTFSAKTFLFEFMGFLLLLIMATVGIFSYPKGEKILFLVFVFYLVNIVLVWYFVGLFYLTLVLLSVLGMLLSFPMLPEKKDAKETEFDSLETIKQEQDTPYSEVFAPTQPEEKSAKTKSTFTPGKLVASKSSTLYHLPKCEWAKKIKKERRVWFTSKEDAWEKGYRAHSCMG